jgi:hypothetical protein
VLLKRSMWLVFHVFFVMALCCPAGITPF